MVQKPHFIVRGLGFPNRGKGTQCPPGDGGTGGEDLDGFKVLLILNKRFDIKTATTMLQAYQEFANPAPIKTVNKVDGKI